MLWALVKVAIHFLQPLVLRWKTLPGGRLKGTPVPVGCKFNFKNILVESDHVKMEGGGFK